MALGKGCGGGTLSDGEKEGEGERRKGIFWEAEVRITAGEPQTAGTKVYRLSEGALKQ